MTPAAPASPPAFGFDDLDRSWLLAKPGVKWSICRESGALASWVADMDMPPPPAVLDRLRRVIDGGDLGYPNWRGYLTSPLPTLFATRMAERFGWTIDPADCIELNEVVQGIQIALAHTTEPGDGVVLHTPAYPPFLTGIATMGRRLVSLPAERTSAGWEFDLDALDAELTARPARALILCHPHNPTGRLFRRPELERLAVFAARHDLTVISDEIHADLVFAPERHVPFASISDDAAQRTVTITSSSKAFNLAGLRWAIAHIGPSWLRDRLRALPNHLYGVPNVMAVEATTAAWTEGDAWAAALLAHLDANRELVARTVRDRMPGIDHVRPEATYLAWLDCRAVTGPSDPEPAERALAGGVRLSPGPDFAAPGFARLNFATSTAVLTEVLDRLAAVFGPK